MTVIGTNLSEAQEWPYGGILVSSRNGKTKVRRNPFDKSYLPDEDLINNAGSPYFGNFERLSSDETTQSAHELEAKKKASELLEKAKKHNRIRFNSRTALSMAM